MGRVLALLLSLAAPALACKCLMSLSACHEAALSGEVFAGTVESIEPSFLRDWNPSQRAGLLRLNEEFARAKAQGTAASLAKLKDTYRSTFPDISEDRKRKLDAAKTAEDLAGLFYGILDSGKQVKFHVMTVFKQDDDDDEKKPDTSKQVWTPFGDCGYDFQVGETYLVYADSDEETGILSTGACTRTRRLSDAGDDLAYLYFREHGASRLEGFVTANELYQKDYDKMHDPEQVKSPVSGVVVALGNAAGTRHVRSAANGRFVFDGLKEGDYTLSAFTGEYPAEVAALAGPQRLHVDEKACVMQMVLVPKR